MLPIMPQQNGNNTATSLNIRTNGIPHKEYRDALLEAKDRIIAELKEQIALLRSELNHKDVILSRIAEELGEMPSASISHAADVSQKVAKLEEVRDSNQAKGDQEKQEKPERPALPNGYRVLAIASDAWVLVAPRGLRVAAYRGELDLQEVALDAREHHQRK